MAETEEKRLAELWIQCQAACRAAYDFITYGKGHEDAVREQLLNAVLAAGRAPTAEEIEWAKKRVAGRGRR